MIIPIFIPTRNDEHGYGCECPSCKQDKIWDSKPRIYYSQRYALPIKWFIKNTAIKVLSYIPLIIGTVISIYMMCNIGVFEYYSLLFVPFFLLFFYIFTLIDKKVKYNFKCPDVITLKIDGYYVTKKQWKEKIANSDIPKGYVLTKPTDEWRFQ